MSRYPPAPWRMRGPAVIVVAPIPAATARALVPPGVRPLVLGGRGIGIALIADYRQGSPLRYGETAGLVATASPRIGGFVDSMLVDLDASRAGGREMWNVPKEMARFTWHGDPPEAVEVHDAAGSLVIAARWHPVLRAAPLPARAAFLGALDGAIVAGTLRGTGSFVPRRVELDIPSTSPLARLQLGRPRLGLAGAADALAGGGRPVPAST